MLKVYKMPNGRRYRFDESNVPQEAILVGQKQKEPEKKPAKKSNKAKKPANKAKKAEKK